MEIEITKVDSSAGEAWAWRWYDDCRLVVVNFPELKGAAFILSGSAVTGANGEPGLRYNTPNGDSGEVFFPSLTGWDIFAISLRDKQIRVAFTKEGACDQEECKEITPDADQAD